MARLFTVASDEALIEMIVKAAERLVIVAPGLSRNVAEAVGDRIKNGTPLRELSVTLDTDPEICRLGYGELDALNLLQLALASQAHPLQTQPGVRIGLIVADEDVLVFSPTPKLIEAGSIYDEKPNAIRITAADPQELAFACGARDTSVLGLTQEVGLNAVTEQAVAKANADLEQNPPRKFDLVRLERVFNYKLEFVEFSIEGYRLNTRVVPLPPVILGLAEKDLKERLRNTFRIFEGVTPFTLTIADPNDNSVSLQVNEKWFGEEARELREHYFIPLGSSSYGNLIQKRNKAQFLAKLERLTKVIDAYCVSVTESIAATIRGTRDSLVESLLPRVQANPPVDWAARSLTGTPSSDDLRRRLESEIDHAFQKADQKYSPKVICIFKGVQYETITGDEEFRNRVVNYFGEEDAAKLLFEYNASRAEEPIHK